MPVLVWGPCEVECVKFKPSVCVRAPEWDTEEVPGCVLDKVSVKDCVSDDETETDSDSDGVSEGERVVDALRVWESTRDELGDPVPEGELLWTALPVVDLLRGKDEEVLCVLVWLRAEVRLFVNEIDALIDSSAVCDAEG